MRSEATHVAWTWRTGLFKMEHATLFLALFSIFDRKATSVSPLVSPAVWSSHICPWSAYRAEKHRSSAVTERDHFWAKVRRNGDEERIHPLGGSMSTALYATVTLLYWLYQFQRNSNLHCSMILRSRNVNMCSILSYTLCVLWIVQLLTVHTCEGGALLGIEDIWNTDSCVKHSKQITHTIWEKFEPRPLLRKLEKKNHIYAFHICLVKNTVFDLGISVEIYKMAIFSYTVKTAVPAQSLKVAIAQPYTAEPRTLKEIRKISEEFCNSRRHRVYKQ